MKYLRTIVVLILLIGFPLVSYYYLNEGFHFRKDALASVKTKGPLKDICKSFPTGSGETVVLVHESQKSDKNVQQYLENVALEFKDEFLFKIKTIPNIRDGELDLSVNTKIECNLDSDKMILIDTGGMIRNYYGYSLQDFNNLMEDIAIVLPRKIQRDIKEKKYETQ